MSARLETATIDTDAALLRLALEWDLLWRSAPQATPFQAPGWLLSWWEIFAPGTLSIVTVRRQGALIGLAPLYLEAGDGPARLLPLGVPITDYSDILVQPASKREAVHALSDHLARSASWQSLHWPDLPQDAGASSLAFPSSYRQTVGPPEVCPYLPLPETVAELATTLPPRKSRSLRMAAYRAERRGKVTLHSLPDRPAENMLADLFVLHRLCWQMRGESGVLDDDRVQRFHMRAASKLAAAGVLRCYALQIGGETAAVYYGFLRGEHAYGYLTGFNPAFSYESPGTLVVAHAIREAVREGARAFHFLRGGEVYKYGWGAQDRWNTSRTIRRAHANAEA
ncbi:MAG TPA: GNAT family N-acetyltransferase [Hyphomicrobiales bacterium]|jgi:CelD/BcsL family acetyltransferase involved in cellulose biosynthesis